MDLSDIRFLFGYDRWATQRILAMLPGIDDDVWTADDAVGSRGLGTIVVHMLGAHQRWRHAIARTGEGPHPEDDPLPSVEAVTDAWAAGMVRGRRVPGRISTTSCSPIATRVSRSGRCSRTS